LPLGFDVNLSGLIDEFCDALWLEDRLARNTHPWG